MERATDAYEDAVRWLNNPANKRRWVTGSAAMRAAPADSKVCPPLYPHPAFMTTTGEVENPGGHASGDPGCKCPTHKCAFKPSVRGRVDDKKRIAKENEGRMWRIENSRPVTGSYAMDGGMGQRSGNLRAARSVIVQDWSLLMAIDAMSSLYAMMGSPAPYRPPNMTDPQVMKKLFPEDVDVAAGKIPVFLRDTNLAVTLSLYGGGQIPATFTLPHWIYGFTLEETRGLALPPLIGQVAAVQAQMGGRAPQMSGVEDEPVYRGWSAGPQGGWGELYGADSYGTAVQPQSPPGETQSLNQRLQDRIKNMIQTGEISRVPVAPPSSIPAAQIQEVAVAAAQGALNEEEKKTPGLPLPAKIGIGAAVASLLGLGAYAAFSR